MERRALLVMAATLPLYLGPLLAGLSGSGWAAVPVFVALMALWLVVMRPHQWPRRMALWTPAMAVTAVVQVAINAVVVVGLFGIGRGIGAVSGLGLGLPPLVPVGLAFLSIPLSRLVWDPVKEHQMDQFLDQALEQIHAINRGEARFATGNGTGDGTDPMLAALLDLPDAADPALTAEAIAAAMAAPGAGLRLSQLEDALDYGPEARRGLREGLILWATDPVMQAAAVPHGAQITAFAAAGFDERLLALFAQRALPLLQAEPELWSSFPEASAIGLALDGSQPAEVQDLLRALVVAVEAATPGEAQGGGG